MTEVVGWREAVAELVNDGDSVINSRRQSLGKEDSRNVY